MALEQIRTIEDLIKTIMPKIPLEAKSISITTKGWHLIRFTTPFKTKPTLVVTLEGDLAAWYSPPTFPKTTITIPKITAPSITLPTFIKVEVPEPRIDPTPLRNMIGYRFVCGVLVKWVCDMLNPVMDKVDEILRRMISVVDTVNDGFKKARQALIDLQTKLVEFRDNLQRAVNEQIVSLNAVLEEQRKKAEEAINTAIADSEKAVVESINKLWEMFGQEAGRTFLPGKTRNVTPTSFEVYTPSPCIVHYVAVEK